jgi:LacI family transcriptional regulator
LTLNDLNLNDADIQYGDFTFESGRRCAELLLAQEQRPSAVICANDEMAAGVFQTAAALGLNIPRDLSVTGFDNSPVASHLWPPLTSVRQPVQEMTALAVELLVNPRDQTEAIQQFEAQVVARASTAQINS